MYNAATEHCCRSAPMKINAGGGVAQARPKMVASSPGEWLCQGMLGVCWAAPANSHESGAQLARAYCQECQGATPPVASLSNTCALPLAQYPERPAAALPGIMTVFCHTHDHEQHSTHTSTSPGNDLCQFGSFQCDKCRHRPCFSRKIDASSLLPSWGAEGMQLIRQTVGPAAARMADP